MTGVPRSKRCFARGGDTGDLDIADFNCPADLPLPGGDRSRGLRRRPIERQHAAAENVVNGSIEGVIEPVAPTARSQNGDTKTDLEDCNGRRPN